MHRISHIKKKKEIMAKKEIVPKNMKTKNKKKNIKLPKRRSIIRGPKSTWIIYLDHVRKQNLTEHKHLNFGSLCKIMSPTWNNMNTDEKQPFVEDHKIDRLRYYNDLSNLSDIDRKILKAHKRLRRKNQKNKPKMPLSPYMRFANEIRVTIINEQPNIKFQDVGRELGKRWRSLSDIVKDSYIQAKLNEKEQMKIHVEPTL